MDYQVTCPKCRANIGLMAVQVGLPTHCPHCKTTFSVADPTERDPSIPLGKVFSFHCAQCQCRLEAHTGMVGQAGQCPTCAAEFRVPPPDSDAVRTGGTKPETEYAQPVHAYAAAGARAPKIVHLQDGQTAIQGPRCGTINDVDRNNCRQCAAPFTLEGAAQGSAVPDASDGGGFGLASLILGIISVPGSMLVLPPILAIVFGILALRHKSPPGAPMRWQPMVGLVLAVLGVVIAVAMYLA
jgi:hypothetical protein